MPDLTGLRSESAPRRDPEYKDFRKDSQRWICVLSCTRKLEVIKFALSFRSLAWQWDSALIGIRVCVVLQKHLGLVPFTMVPSRRIQLQRSSCFPWASLVWIFKPYTTKNTADYSSLKSCFLDPRAGIGPWFPYFPLNTSGTLGAYSRNILS